MKFVARSVGKRILAAQRSHQQPALRTYPLRKELSWPPEHRNFALDLPSK